jgi:xylulokinase
MTAQEHGALVIGLDIGSSGAKASAFEVDGMQASTSRRAYAPRLAAGGVAEYDPRELRSAALESLTSCVQAVPGRRVEAVAIDAMMSGALAVDRRGAPLTWYTTTLDTRFNEQLLSFERMTGGSSSALTGSGQATLAPKAMWILRQLAPADAALIAKFTLAGDYVARALTGGYADQAVIDPTYLWTTGLADTRHSAWAPQLLEAVGLAEDQLPRIVASSEIIGTISRETAIATGLPAGCPVVSGCGDQAAGYLGSGVADRTSAADSSGTYNVFAGVCERFIAPTIASSPDVVASAIPGKFHLQSMVIGGGLTREWAASILTSTPGSDGALEAAAAASPIGSRGVSFIPHLGGQGYPPRPRLRGSWRGLNWAHDAGDLYRAVLESIALEQSASMQRFMEVDSSIDIDEVVVYGGGAKSHLWNQMKSDALGVSYVSLGDTNPASLGVAMLAAEAVGIIEDAAVVARAAARPVARYEPDPANCHIYSELRSQYLETLDAEAARQ